MASDIETILRMSGDKTIYHIQAFHAFSATCKKCSYLQIVPIHMLNTESICPNCQRILHVHSPDNPMKEKK